MIFFAADVGGMIISNELGLSMANMMDPSSGQSDQVPGLILSFLAVLTMLTLDLHHGLLLGFARSFDYLPLGFRTFKLGTVRGHGAAHGGHFCDRPANCRAGHGGDVFHHRVFCGDEPRGAQMNVFAESFGIRIVGGLIVLGFTLQIAAQYIANYLHRLPEDLLGLSQLLAGGAR